MDNKQETHDINGNPLVPGVVYYIGLPGRYYGKGTFYLNEQDASTYHFVDCSGVIARSYKDNLQMVTAGFYSDGVSVFTPEDSIPESDRKIFL